MSRDGTVSPHGRRAVWPVIIGGRLEGGAVVMNVARLRRLLAGRRDCDLEILIDRQHATRSLQQNAAYWAVYVRALSEHTGYSPNEIHELLKAKFLPRALAVTDGNGVIKGEFVIGGSTRRLNKIEFGDYLEAIARWAAEELDIVIPQIGEFGAAALDGEASA